MSTRRARGEPVDSRNVKKHRNDVSRLVTMIPPGLSLRLPPAISMEMAEFLRRLTIERHDLAVLDIRGTPDEIRPLPTTLPGQP
ncbi:MAG: hypothetical protein ACI4SG_09105 [Oligosphaeraceae bacterium]